MLPLTNLIRQYHEVEKEQDLEPEGKASDPGSAIKDLCNHRKGKYTLKIVAFWSVQWMAPAL